MFWFSLLLFVATTILSELLRPKPKFDAPQPSSLGDFNFPTAEEGRAIPVAWGTCHIKGPNVLWYGNLSVQPVTEEVKTGLFSKSTVVKGYRYFMTIHLSICHGVIGTSGAEGLIDASTFEVRFDNRVPAQTISEVGSHDNALVRGFGQHVPLDASGDTRPGRYAFAIADPFFFGGDEKEGGIVGPVHVYPGGLWHAPNDHLQGLLGEDIPAYRGIATAVVAGAYIGTSAFVKPISFVLTRCPSPRLYLEGDTTADANANINGDANPAYMILEILMDTVWGLGTPQALIDLDSFYGVAATLKGEGLGMSYVLDDPAEAQGIIGDILRHIDGVLYTDPATGLFTLKLARKDYSESDLVQFDESSIVSCDFSRGSWSETKNVVKIIYIDGRASAVAQVPATRAYHMNNDLDDAISGALPLSLHGDAAFHVNAKFGSHGIGLTASANPWYADTENAGTDHFDFDVNEFLVSVHVYVDAFPDGTANHEYAMIFHSAQHIGGGGATTLQANGQYALFLKAGTRQLLWVHRDANGNHREMISGNDVLGDPGVDYVHVAVGRSGGTLRLMVEGEIVASMAVGSADILFGGSTFAIGGFGSTPFYALRGVIDELHIVNGNDVWSSFPFTPPSEEQDYLTFSTTHDGDFVKKTAQQQNLANIQARGGELAAEIIPFLGISNSENANKIAARVLKTLSYPFAAGKIVVNRKGWQLRPGSVFIFDWPPLGISGMIARVTNINYGELLRNRIEIDAVEDVFGLAGTAFSAPAPTEWEDPVQDIAAAAAERLVELPYHFIGAEERYIATLATRASQMDLGYQVWSDRDGDTTTDLLQTNDVQQFVPSATLVSAYDGCGSSGAFDVGGFAIEDGTDLDSLTSINATQLEQGVNLLLVDNEFMAWRTITDNGDGTFTVSRIIRGVLDTLPADHDAGARVWFFTDGFGLADTQEYPSDITVAAKLLTYNGRGSIDEGDAALMELTLDSRAIRPYPPGNVLVNGEECPGTFVDQDVTITWSHRHRVLQTQDQVVVRQDADDYTDTPEGDYILEIYVGETLKHTFEDFMLGSNMELLYTLVQRQADDADLTKAVTMVLTPINADGLTGTARSISFLMSSSAPPSARGLFFYGKTGSDSNVIDYVEIDTAANAVDFGDATVARRQAAPFASSTRAIAAGGFTTTYVNVIDYVTIASAGNATDFGDLTVARIDPGGCSSETRGISGGGANGAELNTIDYVTIASAGNATDFGDLTVARRGVAGLASTTRGVFGFGSVQSGASGFNTIDYVTIASAGNATDFGDLTANRGFGGGASSSTRGLFAGGGEFPTIVDTIEYITIASAGNATDFGDLTVARSTMVAGCSSPTRAVFGGGSTGSNSDVIDYVTIASAGDATDFGDLTVARFGVVGTSNGHGGL